MIKSNNKSNRKRHIVLFQSHGCDLIIGSHKKADICGVCGGDNSTCTLVTEVFDEQDLDRGYNYVATIPKGATHFKVTQQRSGSRNYIGGFLFSIFYYIIR